MNVENAMVVFWKSFIVLHVLLISGSGTAVCGESPSEPRSERTEELKAVRFSDSEDAATRELNDLAVLGWRYVGPLGNGLIAFPRGAPISAAASPLQGDWGVSVIRERWCCHRIQPEHRMTLSISGEQWSVGPSPGPSPSHRVDISGGELVFHGIVAAGSPATGETTPPHTVAWGLYELKGDSLIYCMTPNVPESSSLPGMGNFPVVEKPVSFETTGTTNHPLRLRKKQ